MSSDDWEYIEDMYVQLGLGAVQLMMADHYGVVSPTDPTLVSSKALLPEVDPGNQFHYWVRAGGAVTPKGQFTYLPFDLDLYILDPKGQPLADGQLYVILLRYLLVELESDNVLTRAKFYLPKYTRLAPPATRLMLMRYDDYVSAAPSSLYDAVALGVVRVTSASGALTTALTITNDAYPFNRPWFSPVDVWHRNRTGTGTITDSNPHGQTLEDFDVGPVPLFQLQRTAGGIVAKDYQYPRCPGHLVRETIQSTALVHGVVATLQQRPAALGTLTGTTTGKQYAYYYDHVYNQIVILNPIHSTDLELTLAYTTATSLTPRLVGQTVRVGAAGSWEAVISEGRIVMPAALTAEQDVDLSDLGGEVQTADVFVSGTGVAFRNPQTLLCGARLQSDFSGGRATPTASLKRVGLPRVLIVDQVALTAIVTLSGTDSLGQTLTEAITVNYVPPPLFYPTDPLPHELDSVQLPAGVTLPPELTRQRRLVTGTYPTGSFFYGTKLFATLTSIQIDQLTGSSRDGTLTLQAVLDARGCCKLASLVTADHRPVNLTDARLVDCNLRDSEALNATDHAALITAATNITATMGTAYCKSSFVETFTQPGWADVAATALAENADDSGYYKSRAIPLNIRAALAGSGYDLTKSTPDLLIGHLPESWRELLTPEPSTIDWRASLAQVPVFQWVWQYLHGSGLFRRLTRVLPQSQFPDGGALRDVQTTPPRVLAVQCLGAPEWARLTVTRYGLPDGSHDDDAFVFDGPRWVTGTPIDLVAALPWSPEYTKSLYVEVRGRSLLGYVAVVGRLMIL